MDDGHVGGDLDGTLRQRFPELRPIGGPPPLFGINGCGLRIYGRRDFDRETRTYVATYCVTLLFLPVLALGAYRVADAPGGGWYFLGKEPISGLAKMWNLALLGTAIALGAIYSWGVYTSSPEYRMAGRLRQGREAESAGQARAAFRAYAQVADSGTSSAAEASGALEEVIAGGLASLPAGEAEGLVRLAAERAGQGRPTPAKKTVLAAAYSLADARLAAEPRRALAVLDSVRALAGDSKDHAARRSAALRAAAAKEPEDPDLASELAALLESEGDLAGCEKLLAPLAGKLGSREGARILGSIYVSAGKFDEARGLLTGYCAGRLKLLHGTSKELEKLQEAVANSAVARLRSGLAGAHWYETYERKDKAGQQAMVDEYVAKAIRADQRLKKLCDRLVAQAVIVPVALDLGMVMLRRAQGLSGEERRRELLAAEQVFLAVQGVASSSDTYRVSYGQVLYWLGKAEEGRKLFDEYLASKKRASESLYIVASILREVGATSESWALGEEAYAAEKDAAKKQGIAEFMAASTRDIDDTVVWLERCNQADKRVQAHLASSKGHLAERDGKDAEAEAHYRRSTTIYAGLPRNATVLNNAALVHMSLFRLTGKAEDHRRASAMLEEAVGMGQDDSILAGNAAGQLANQAVLDLTAGRLDYKALGMSPHAGFLLYLYDDQAGRDEVVSRYTQSQPFRRALERRRRAVLLAPRSQHDAAALVELLGWLRDETSLGELQVRMKEVALDLEGYRKESLDVFAGKKEAESRKVLELAIARLGKVAGRPRSGPDDLTPDVAGVQVLSLELAASDWGRDLDFDAAVTRAEKLVAARPCLASRSLLNSVLCCRMSRRLAAANPGYAAALKKCKRSLGDKYVLLLVAENDPAFRAAAAADPDMKRLLALDREDASRLPKHVGIWQWALRRQFSPETARQAGDLIGGDRIKQLRIELDRQIAPMNAGNICDFYWLLRLRGEEQRARDVLRQAAKDGVPLPWVP